MSLRDYYEMNRAQRSEKAMDVHAEKTRAVQLGDTVFDPITGFEGIAVGRSEWLWGARQVCVQAMPLDKDGRPAEEIWFHEARLGIRQRAGHTTIMQSDPQAGAR